MASISRFTLKLATSALVFGAGLASGAAFASGPVTVTPPDVYVAPAPVVRDWAGLYGGLSYSAVSGGITDNIGAPGLEPDFESVGAGGAFLGYNWQRGNLVYGGEVNYTSFDTPYTGFINRQQNALDLRARVGYAVNNVLVYGFVGAAQSTITGGPGVSYTQNGYSYGLGLQTFVSNHVFVGVEAARRSVDFATGAIGVTTQIDTISLRLGYQF